MTLPAPRITIYSKNIDNITNHDLSNYSIISNNTHLTFGRINGITGGESSTIIEFDIWNNESAIMGGTSVPAVSDAINCRFSAWDDIDLKSSSEIQDPITLIPYVQARCVTQAFGDFQPIGGPIRLDSNKIFNSVSSTPGFISGQSGGDHVKIQTKIVIPPNTDASFKNFVFEFSYDYV